MQPHRNYITGELSPFIYGLVGLQVFNCSGNSLGGTIPNSMSNLTNLQVLDLSENFFTGTIPNEFSGLKMMREFFVEKNRFNGPIFNTSHWPSLESFDVGDNYLTGMIPDVSGNVNLTVYGASKNCLELNLEGFCGSTSLVSLYLNGLHQNKGCAEEVSLSFMTDEDDIVDNCIWQVQSLEKLYLAGNGMVGNMDNFNLPKIIELNINTNRFHGTVPAFFSNATMNVFDISRNTFTGVYSIYTQPQASLPQGFNSLLKTDVNRLSGKVEVFATENYQTVSVLEGNIIECPGPSSDTNFHSYSCGSQLLEYSIYTWLVCFSLSVVFCLFVRYDRSYVFFQEVRLLLRTMHDTTIFYKFEKSLSKARQLFFTLKRFMVFTLLYGLSLLLVMTVVYAIMSTEMSYKSYAIQYTYTLSGLFLREHVPAVCIALCFSLFFFLLVQVPATHYLLPVTQY